MKTYACVIPVYAKSCFMMKRKSKHHIESWEFPAGKGDPGEDTKTTAIREYFEETGARILPKDLKLLMTTFTTTLYSTEDHWQNDFFITQCKLITTLKIQEPETHSEAKWFRMEEIIALRNAGLVVPTSATVVEVLSQNI